MKPTLASLLFLIAETAFSQSYTERGVVVDLSGDTLRGEITIPRSDKNPAYIDLTNDGTKKRYRPDQVKYFRMGKEPGYIGVITEVDKSPTNPRYIQHQRSDDNPVAIDTVFLMIVVIGKMSLYKLMDERDGLHFFVGNDGTITQLLLRVQRKLFTGGGGLGTYDVYSEIYKDQLKSMISNCPQAEPLIDKTDYSTSSLTSLVLSYNSCHKHIPVYVQKPSRPTLVVGVFGGLMSSSLDNRDGAQGPHSTAHYGRSKAPTGGLVLELLAPKTVKRFSIVAEFMVYRVDFAADYTDPSFAYFYNLEYFRANLGGRYYFTEAKLKPYLQAGVGMGRAYRTSHYSGQPVNRTFKPTKADQGLNFAAGVKYKRIGVQLRYDRTPGFSERIGFMKKIENTSVLLTIDFTRPKEN